MRVLGTCSICGGAVTVPHVWMGLLPPTPTCMCCGAKARDNGPVIPMQLPDNVTVIKTREGTIRIASNPSAPMGSIAINPSEWTP